jgi:hypothetical protein
MITGVVRGHGVRWSDASGPPMIVVPPGQWVELRRSDGPSLHLYVDGDGPAGVYADGDQLIIRPTTPEPQEVIPTTLRTELLALGRALANTATPTRLRAGQRLIEIARGLR